jgi:hypothetical protein
MILAALMGKVDIYDKDGEKRLSLSIVAPSADAQVVRNAGTSTSRQMTKGREWAMMTRQLFELAQ